MTANRLGGAEAEGTGARKRRRSWSADERRRIVAEATAPGASVAGVALGNDVNANLVFKWIREARMGRRELRRPVRAKAAGSAITPSDSRPPAFAPVRIVEEMKNAPPSPPDEAPSAPSPSRAAITITLLNGARIEIGADAGEAALRLALSVVKAF